MRKLITALLVATVVVIFTGVLPTQAPHVHEQEVLGRAVVMVARGWKTWPTKPDWPLCEWRPQWQEYRVTPCTMESGIIIYRNAWPVKRWGPTQRKEL